MKKAKILIVEDEAIIATEIENQLQSLGYEITSIVDTDEKAIQKAGEDKPDVILMDIRIKGAMDGIDVAEVIRNRFDIPVVFLTTNLDEEKINYADYASPFGHVQKPVQKIDLKMAIEMALYVMRVNAKQKKIEIALAESEKRYKGLLNILDAGVVVHAADTSIILNNPKASDILGLTEEQMRGKEAIDPQWLFYYEDGKPVPLEEYPVNRVFSTKQDLRNMVMAINRPQKNDRVWVLINGFPVFNANEEIEEVIINFIDITKRKEAEIEREALIKDLESKNEELERFTYTVSHDLKSPLITIKGFLGMLEKDAVEGNVDQMKSDINRISKAADKMQSLLEELLELSRIGRMVNPSSRVLFKDLAQKAVDTVIGRLRAKEVNIEIDTTPVEIIGDITRLSEVMENLIDNAAKFSGDGEPTKIIISTRQQAGDTIYFVQDNGIGIKPKYHEKVFGLFDKLDQKAGGTGIGLAIAKRVIEIHGGRIWVESEGEGKGTTFCFTVAESTEKNA
jgi:PAS domain S-box-containing protein